MCLGQSKGAFSFENPYPTGYPSVGRGMVIFRDPNGHRMVTTVPRSIEGGFLVREPVPHGASPALRRPVGRFRQADSNRRLVLSKAVPSARRSLPHDGRTKVVVS